MPDVRTIRETIGRLRTLFETERFQDQQLHALDAQRRDYMWDAFEQNLSTTRQIIEKVMDDFAHFPPKHVRHAQMLEAFYAAAGYERSVLIMTKFPDGKDEAADRQLKRIIDAVRLAIQNCGFEPRVADEQSRFHPAIWDNVELHLLGCKRGVAILEDRYRQELNPNVAMEWGWMRGLDRDVLYLREETFSQERADILGLSTNPFSWDDPETGVTRAIDKWLRNVKA
jgi:hypothetical protein